MTECPKHLLMENKQHIEHLINRINTVLSAKCEYTLQTHRYVSQLKPSSASMSKSI